MKQIEMFLMFVLLLFVLGVWFFPKPVEEVTFLGFSDPILLEQE